jgi:TolA-binding protein
MKKPALLALLLVLGAWEAPAQAPAPFVSRLQAKTGQSSVQLSWRTVPGFTGTYRIYRHTLEIDAATFPQAVQVGSVGAAAGTYEDFPAAGSYYYAVLLDDGKLSLLFVPFRNKTSSPVQVASAAPERGEAARITGLAAEVSGDAVRLGFQSSRGDRELLLFRSLQPMRSGEDLTSTPLPLEAGRRDFEDFPIPGLDYYYALVDAGLFKLGKPELVLGQNSTLQPVRVPLDAGRVGLPPAVMEEVPSPQPVPAGVPAPGGGRPPAAAAPGTARAAAPAPRQPAAAPASEQIAMASARSAPLPYLDLGAARGLSSPPLPASRPLGPLARRAVEAMLREAPAREAPRLRAQALPEDLGAASGAEDAALGAIATEHLLTGRLPEAEKGLRAFLALPRTEAAAARARFFLGQVYYLQGKLQPAVLELLLARPRYYTAVQPWLENCLQRLSGS